MDGWTAPDPILSTGQQSFSDAQLDAIIDRESAGNPKAVNPKSGALGLAQVMPDTARDPGYGVAPLVDPFDPKDSRRFMRDYTSAMLREFDGDRELALMAYNWGPERTKAWAEGGRKGEVPRETRDYVDALLPQMSQSSQTGWSAPDPIVQVGGDAGGAAGAYPSVVSEAAKSRFLKSFGAGPSEPALPSEPEDEGHSEFWKGFGGYLMQQGPEDIARSAEAIGVLMGSDWLENTAAPAIMGIKGTDEEAFVPKVSDLSQIEWDRLAEAPGEVTDQILDFAEYGLGQGLASTLPSLMASIAGGAAGAALGGPAAPITAPVGMILGATATSYAQNTGPLYDDLLKEGLTPEQAAPWAAGGGVVLAALDAAFPATAASKLMGGVKRKVRRGLVKRIMQEAGKGAAQEAITEALQEVASEAIVAEAGERDIDWRDMAIRAATGATIGGMTGGLIGGATGIRSDRDVGQPPAEIEAATEAQPQPPPGPPPEPPEEAPEQVSTPQPAPAAAEAPPAPPIEPVGAAVPEEEELAQGADATQLASAQGLPPAGAEVTVKDADAGIPVFGGRIEIYDVDEGGGLIARVIDEQGRAFEAPTAFYGIEAAVPVAAARPVGPDAPSGVRRAELERIAGSRDLTLAEAEELGSLQGFVGQQPGIPGAEPAAAAPAPAAAPPAAAVPEVPETVQDDLAPANEGLPEGYRIERTGAGTLELIGPDGTVLEEWGDSPQNVRSAQTFAEQYDELEPPGVFGEEAAAAEEPPAAAPAAPAAPEPARPRPPARERPLPGATVVREAPAAPLRRRPGGRPARRGEVFRSIKKAAGAVPPEARQALPPGQAVQQDMLGGPEVTERELALRDAVNAAIEEMHSEGLSDADIVRETAANFDDGVYDKTFPAGRPAAALDAAFRRDVARRVLDRLKPEVEADKATRRDAAAARRPQKPTPHKTEEAPEGRVGIKDLGDALLARPEQWVLTTEGTEYRLVDQKRFGWVFQRKGAPKAGPYTFAAPKAKGIWEIEQAADAAEEHAAKHEFSEAPAPKKPAEKAAAPKAPADKKTSPAERKRDETQLRDWSGVQVPSYNDDGKTKAEFQADARRYAMAVAKLLANRGFAAGSIKGKPLRAVRANKAGPAVSGEVSLSMYRSDGIGIYMQISTANTGPDGGISILARRAMRDTDRFGSRQQNQWLPIDLAAKQMADRLETIAGVAEAEGKPGTAEEIEAAAAEVDTDPTEAQKEAGNYKKGHVMFQGLDITIENPKGSERSGTDPDGKPWSVKMPAHYGYVKGTEGADGEQVDVYLGPLANSDRVFVVHQKDLQTGKFDEHKVMLGFGSEGVARRFYERGFSDGRGADRIMKIDEMDIDTFKIALEKSAFVKGSREARAPKAPKPLPGAAKRPKQTPLPTRPRTKFKIGDYVSAKPSSGLTTQGTVTHIQDTETGQDLSIDGGPHYGAGDFIKVVPKAEPEPVPAEPPTAPIKLMQLPGTRTSTNVEFTPTGLVQIEREYPGFIEFHRNKLEQDAAGMAEMDLLTPQAQKRFEQWKAVYEGAQRLLDNEAATQPAPATEEAPAKTDNDKADAVKELAEILALTLRQRRDAERSLPLTWRELFAAADEAFGGTQAEGTYSPRDAYDALEMAINMQIGRSAIGYMREEVAAYRAVDIARNWLGELVGMLSVVPTQSKRTREQIELQQFSTPPTYGMVAAWVANIGENDVVVEPSAGTGSIAIFAKNAQPAEVVVNEIAPRRARILRDLGFDPVISENAEHLNAVLPAEIKPTVVVMNPPFSETGGRLKTKAGLHIGLQHVEQALKRLEPGGRLVAVLGKSRGKESSITMGWWSRIRKEYALRADLTVSGKVYQKYGTTFPTKLVVFDKVAPDNRPPVTTAQPLESLSSAIDMLAEVRDARIHSRKRAPVEPSGARPVADSPGDPGRGRPVPGAAPGVGPGRAPGLPGAEPVRGTAPGAQPVREAAGRDDEPAGGRGQPARGERPAGEPAPGRAKGARGRAKPGRLVETTVQEVAGGSLDTGVFSDTIFSTYQPQRLHIPGARPHPGTLMQSTAMAAVLPPAPTHKPTLDPAIITEGRLSLPQLEAVVYAGQAHSQMLPSVGEEKPMRRGFFIGDGTGVGKGREIAGIIEDNWNQGRHKALWFTTDDSKLLKAAQRDYGGVMPGAQKRLLKFPGPNDVIKAGEGVLLSSYAKLAKNVEGRLEQLKAWLGEDFDGVIAFDEAHKMGNAIRMKAKRGFKEPSKTAIAGMELQRAFPNARVVYVSATGATEVANLAYGDRLGLWGRGMPFQTKADFIHQVTEGGVAAMELIARDMKALGMYASRNLSYEDVRYERLNHEFSPAQAAAYDRLAEAWQVTLQNFDKALALVATDADGKVDGKAKSAAYSAFWSAHQRFFNQVLTAFEMPSVIERVERDLAEGHTAVLQLVNTMEASQERALGKEGALENLDELDLTPRDQLFQMVERSFPVAKKEQYDDEDGNTRWRGVVDSKGDPVTDPEAEAMRDALLKDLETIKVPSGPLELLLDHFGPEKVAEVTGRSRRVVMKPDERTGERRRVVEKRSKTANMADIDNFLSDKKQVLVFSAAGGTGVDYHASLDAKNQRLRRHYLVQAGWRADEAVQGLGRTHRSNQAQAPVYILVSTDLKGHKRFLSSVARRLAQLGALTKGQRQATGGELFSERDNLENDYAKAAVRNLVYDIARQQVEGVSLAEFEKQLGLKMRDEQGSMIESKIPDVPQFLNRLLSLKIDMQNRVFGLFEDRMNALVQAAEETGTLDVGVETYRADKLDWMQEQVVHTDEKSGAETRYVEIKESRKTSPLSFDDAQAISKLTHFYRNKKSGRVYAVQYHNEIMTAEGYPEVRVRRHNPQGHRQYGRLQDFQAGYGPKQKNNEMLTAEQAQPLWQAEYEKVPEFTTHPLHLITGVILPIWDRLGGAGRKIYRLQTDDGRRYLGRVLEPNSVRTVLENLGALEKPDLTPQQAVDAVMNKGETLELSNGWKIERRRVSGENRMEIVGVRGGYTERRQIAQEGVVIESIQYQDRYFIPTGDRAAEIMGNITEYREIVRLGSQESEADDEGGGSPSFARTDKALQRRPPSLQQYRAIITAIRSTLAQVAPTADLTLVPEIVAEGPAVERHREASGYRPGDQFAGAYLDGIIVMALNAMGSPRAAAGFAGHEAIHFLKAQSFFTKREWRLLERQARERWIGEFGLPESPGDPTVVEEAIAYAYQFWNSKKPQYGSALNALMAKIRRFFTRLGNALHGMGFQTVEDTFAAVRAGQVGRRPLSPRGARRQAAADLMTLPGLEQETVEAAISMAGADLENIRARFAAAWHGGPHDFDRFSTEHIGTGEGAQTYGWGLYFAGKEAVARHYQNASRKGHSATYRGKTGSDYMAEDIGLSGERGDMIQALSNVEQEGSVLLALEKLARDERRWPTGPGSENIASSRKWLQAHRGEITVKPRARLYKVNLAPEEDEYLYWDKPLSEQSEKVRKAAAQLFKRSPEEVAADESLLRELGVTPTPGKGGDPVLEMTGQQAYETLAETVGAKNQRRASFRTPGFRDLPPHNDKEAASEALRKAGIPGIKYLDQVSRGEGEGTYNYVIFDDSLIDIEAKFSIADTARRHVERFGERAGGLDIETAENVEVERPEIERDLNPLKRFLWVPQRLFKDWPALGRAVARWTARHNLFQATLTRTQQEWDQLTGDLSSAEFEELSAILFLGDANATTYSREDLDNVVGEDGEPLDLSDKVKSTYLRTIKYIEKLGRLVDQHERDMRNYLRRRIKPMLLRHIAKYSSLGEEDVNRLINQRYAARTQFRSGEGDMPALTRRIEEIEQRLGYVSGADEPLSAAIDQLDQVDAVLNRTTVRTRVGYVPHKFFGSWAVYRTVEDVDDEGAPIERRELVPEYAAHGFHPTQLEAVNAANRYASDNPEERIVVRPVGFRFAGSGQMQLRGPQYHALMGRLQEAFEVDSEEIREAVGDVVRPRSKRKWAGFKQFRKGVAGYSKDLDRVMRAHIGEVNRYVALDKIKYEAINIEDSMGLHKESRQRPVLGAAWRAYVRDILGSKQTHEAALDELFERGYFRPLNLGLATGITTFVLAGGLSGNPFVGLALGSWLGYRFYTARARAAELGGFTTRGLTGELLSTTAHLKLGAFLNVFSPIVNLTQIVLNTASVLPWRDVVRGMGLVNQAVAQHYQERAASIAAGREYRDPQLIRLLRRHNIDPVFKHSEISPHLYDKPSKLARYSMFLFDTVEKYNRSVTFLAAYSQAKAGRAAGVRPNNERDAQRYAMNMVTRTQFDYSNVARPEILRDVFARVPLQFKNFVFQQIAFTTGLRGRGEVLKFLAHMFLVAGVLGMPGWQALEALIFWLSDGDISPTVEVKRVALQMAARGELEGTMMQAIARGLPALVGVDISTRAGMGEKFLPSLQMNDMIGPLASTVLRARQLAEAEAGIVDQLRNLSSGLGAPLKALETAANGMPLEGALLDPRAFMAKLGDEKAVIVNPRKKLRAETGPKELDIVDLVMMGAGGRPTSVSRIYDFQHLVNHEITQRDRLNARFLNRIAQAHRKFMPHDKDRFGAAMVTVIAQANEIGHQLNPSSVRRLLRELNMPRSMRAIRQAPRRLRPELLELQPTGN